ncbi:uncharacterized protein [Rutidosis leptorrhynchoides]|uniref:uncharacterized protein n=1 Tax=Rutidosis leptorrhynchoides TaxID=125765 RepID=UPI003A995F04
MENNTCGIKQNTHLAELMHEVRLIIWDEAPMTQRCAFEALDKTLRDILGYKKGRNIRWLFGDLWKYCQLFKLSCIMRVNEYTDSGEVDTRKQKFNKWVLDVGDGNLPAKAKEGEDEPTWIRIPIQFLNSLNFPGMPPHELSLKIGLSVMLLRNVYPSEGQCNGTRLIITDLQKFVIQARIIT